MTEQRWIGHEARMLSNLIRRHMDAHATDEGGGEMTSVQMWMLGYLYRMERDGREVYQRDVEKEFGVRRSTATGILQGLEKRGLITRASVDADRRLKRLTLTDEARTLHRRAVDNIRALETLMCKDIPEHEIELCVSVLRRVRANIERADCAQAAGPDPRGEHTQRRDTEPV